MMGGGMPGMMMGGGMPGMMMGGGWHDDGRRYAA